LVGVKISIFPKLLGKLFEIFCFLPLKIPTTKITFLSKKYIEVEDRNIFTAQKVMTDAKTILKKTKLL